ncbi:MAG: glutamate-ammonia-ligase adenylyltransferase [Pirellulaceae bacterium]|nr:MAG: glutamate-ammonia-ligase adenylyltransferase [Pirellulaceae bacterium]
MTSDDARSESPAKSPPWDVPIEAMARLGEALRQAVVPDELIESFLTEVQSILPPPPAGSVVVPRLQEFLTSVRSPLSWLSLFERDREALLAVVTILGASERLATELLADPEALELLRITGGRPIDAERLYDELSAELATARTWRRAQHIVRDYRHRETLRIAFGDLMGQLDLDAVMEQLTSLARVLLRAALEYAMREVNLQLGTTPHHAHGAPIQLAVIGLGALASEEMDYGDALEFLVVREDVAAGPVWQETIDEVTVDLYFHRVVQMLRRLLEEPSERGPGYTLTILAPQEAHPYHVVWTATEAIMHFDSWGRTWERQRFVKSAPVAGNTTLGNYVLSELHSWIYRRYLLPADSTGMATLRRQLQRRAERLSALREGTFAELQVLIAATVSYLQLLHGWEHTRVRASKTLSAIRELSAIDVLSREQADALQRCYRAMLRLQLARQSLANDQAGDATAAEELAQRLVHAPARWREELSGWPSSDSSPEMPDQRALPSMLRQAVELCVSLLENVVPTEEIVPELETPEAEIVLDAQLPPAQVEAVLKEAGFAEPVQAYRRLQEMAVESIPFLSSRRSRHALAMVAQRLLHTVAATPSPDATLVSLANISNSIGGKATLWELFHEHPPSMQLVVALGAASPYLTNILVGNPGMIDELLDSLMLPALPTREGMAAMVAELCRETDDCLPILHRFKNSMHLRIGVRELLGRSSIEQTHAALADVAEVALERIVSQEYHRLVSQMGVPTRGSSDAAPPPADFCVIAMGKLGAREPNYHSNLDLMFLFEGEGMTRCLVPDPHFTPTSNRHFFNRLAQRVIHAVTQSGATGRLYDIDASMRPPGSGGPLATTMQEMEQYFTRADISAGELLALAHARPVWGDPLLRSRVALTLRQLFSNLPWSSELAHRIAAYRLETQRDASERNIKRGAGGIMDIELIVLALQLAHVSAHPTVHGPGTLAGIQRLRDAAILSERLATRLRENYCTLRQLESGIRLLDYRARHEIPQEDEDIARLAYLLTPPPDRSRSNPTALLEQVAAVRQQNRELFDEVFSQWGV